MVQGTGGPPPLTDPTLAGAGSSRGTAQDGSVVGGLASASRASSGELQSGAGRSSAAPSGATTARGQQVGGGSGASVEQVRENGAGPGGRGGYPPSTGVWWDGNLGRGTLPAGGSSQAQIGGPHEVARGGPAPSSSTRRTSSTPTAPPSHQTGRPSFPVLPVSQPLPNQAFQTPTQVQAILSLPTPLLLSLARTSDYAEQHAIASSAQAQSYISSMSLPPPSPDQLIQSLAGPGTPVTTIRDHPAIPLLLGQAFCPPTPGIAAPANPTASRPFEPIYASVEDWSLRAARERVGKARGQAAAQGGSAGPQRPPLVSSHSFTEREITEMATQMKKWALREQEKQVDQQVHSSKEAAVILAIQAAARSNIVKVATAVSSSILTNGARPNGASDADVVAASIVVSGGPAASSAIESAMQNMDLSAYAAQYRKELDALASGYFAQLHREALNRLMSAAETPSHTPPISATPSSTGIFPSSQPPSSTFSLQIAGTAQGRAMHVQAAAAAAVAANVMAANEIASLAGERIASMGFDVLPFLPERSSGGLASLDVTPDALAVPAPRPTQQKTSSKDGAAVQPSEEVSALIAKANATRTCTPEKRDFLLAYAHQVYARDPRSNELLGLLHTLETIHPEHLPTLLLMSCVYYTRGELDSSYFYNSRLLSYDPNYVEAMSNIGTTLRAMGKWKDAETWWWKAIKLRPTYWDATENLLGVLCTPATLSTLASASNLDTPPTTPRYQEALALCDYVESQVYAQSPVAPGASTDRFALYSDPVSAFARPRTLPGVVTNNHVHRLQNLFYAKGNLRLALNDPAGAKDEYEKAIEVALSLPVWVKAAAGEALKYPSEGVSVRDLVVVMTVLGKVVAAHAETDAANSELVLRTIADFGIGNGEGHVAFDSLFRVVRSGGDAYAARLVAMGGGVLPTVLLSPEILSQVMGMLFQQMGGVLPSMIESNGATPPEAAHARQQALQQACQTTSTMLLTLAKVLQDSMGQPGAASSLSLGGIPPSPSLLLPLYYVALALYPSPSTCNNLGILLSTMNATTLVRQHGQPDQPPRLLTGQQLALKYYKAGLQLDPRHPHLFTNLGSLLKDMGQLPQAVLMYKQAVEYNPTFDVALANLANAVKDTGAIQESIPYYRRAVEINPHFPEAICGLVNALGGVCDWIGRGGVGSDWTVDNEGVLSPPDPVVPGQIQRSGYMGQISELVAKQLADGRVYGVGAMRSAGTMDQWLAVISQAIWGIPPSELKAASANWRARLSFFLETDDVDRPRYVVNEGSFIIRLVERLMRRVQRRWYLEKYGPTLHSTGYVRPILVTKADAANYRRPILPPSLPPISVPTVLPFHTFSYPVSPRETRLISHRTGLRISHNTLNQPWLPPHVYPPPPPPLNGVINIGYVSSDFGNHPLSHLMQSVFGLHDRAKFNVFCYATSPSDKSSYRLKIEAEAQYFLDASNYSTQQIVDRIVHDGIHILVNLSGYTKGARNEVFAARPAPVQMSYMGFAGTLSAGWCDYFVVDPVVCPPGLVSGNQWRLQHGHSGVPVLEEQVDSTTDFEGDPDPEGLSESFVYTEKLIYLPHSYFVTDHKQAWRESENQGLLPGELPLMNDGSPEAIWAIEEDRRWRMRKQMFPHIRDDTFIFANWNQLYKIDPYVFRIWLSILAKHRNSILWLLRFPAPGEAHLKEMALKWAGPEIADRVIFTDVAQKDDHIHRGRIADLFLDTTEVNAHTTAADILWSGTPILTFPRHLHKMCSRVAASIALATGFGEEMIVRSSEEYEARALAFSSGLSYDIVPPRQGAGANKIDGRTQRRGRGELSELRRKLFLTREKSALFDTRKWVRNMEKGYVKAWERWVGGEEFEDTVEWQNGDKGGARTTGCIWVEDDEEALNVPARNKWFK